MGLDQITNLVDTHIIKIDCFEQETKYDRTTVFKSILAAMNEADEDKRTLELMVHLSERMLEQAFNGELEVD